MSFATCSFPEYEATTGGIPVRISNGYPRYRLTYPLPGTSKWPLLFPDRQQITWPLERFAPVYLQKLDSLGVQAIRDSARDLLRQLGADENERLVLLCFEQLAKKPDLYCHRTVFATWWTERTGEDVPELGAMPDH